jgi:uncharacterized protein YcbK (DUF882 family)
VNLPDGKWFYYADAACHDGTPYPEEYADEWNRLTIKTKDPIREEWGSPLIDVSVYRSPWYNRMLIKEDALRGLHNVASSSTHVTGEASDIRPLRKPGEDRVLLLHAFVLAKWRRGELPELGGLGLYPDWIHVDVAKAADGHLRQWNTRRA